MKKILIFIFVGTFLTSGNTWGKKEAKSRKVANLSVQQLERFFCKYNNLSSLRREQKETKKWNIYNETCFQALHLANEGWTAEFDSHDENIYYRIWALAEITGCGGKNVAEMTEDVVTTLTSCDGENSPLKSIKKYLK